MMPITDNDLALFRERAKTELESTGDIGRIAWDYVVDELCKEVARLRSVSKERGDAAKLREALETARLFVTNCPTPLTTPLLGCGMSRAEVINIIDAALAAPPRNCDVGTAQEQIKRWQAFCNRYDDDCTGCPCEAADTWDNTSCFAKWAQMPYEEGGAK